MGMLGPWQARSYSQGSHPLIRPPRAPQVKVAAAFWKSQNGSSPPPLPSNKGVPPGPPPLPPEAAPAAAEVAAAAQEVSAASVASGAGPEAAQSAAWWSKLSKQWGQQVKKMGVDMDKVRANFKPPQLGKVKLDVDVMNPTINSIKANWMQLPEPVRQAAPVLGTIIVLTGFTRYIHRDEMVRAEARFRDLEKDHQRLKARKEELESEVSDLSAKIKRANQVLSIEMAEALAKAAGAAAMATQAAANAASACAYLPGAGSQQQAVQQQRQPLYQRHMGSDGDRAASGGKGKRLGKPRGVRSGLDDMAVVEGVIAGDGGNFRG